MAAPALSDEDFTRLQTQLIDLRTQNYELETKLRKTEAENSNLNEKNVLQEKEITKLQRLSKFPGFQAITKSKSKKDIAELMEENDRLTQQMQRHEDDFKLQNQTLMEELSRLSSEKEELQKKLDNSTHGNTNDEENRRLVAENAVLLKTVEDLKSKSSPVTAESSIESTPCASLDEVENHVEEIFHNVIKLLPSSDNGKNDGESVNGYEEILREYMENLKKALRLKTVNNNATSSSDFDFRMETILQEKEMLQNQLNSFKDTSKQELKQLREEVAKWEEKTRKKQESYIKLQEEKENMFEEHRKAIERLKEENIAHEKKGGQVEDLQSRLDIIKTENQAMQIELVVLREKCKIDQSARIKELEDRVDAIKTDADKKSQEIMGLNGQIGQLNQLNESLKVENENLERNCKQANELAENRKSLLDQTSLDRQQDLENHQSKLEGLKAKYELDMHELITKNNEEIEDLKRQIVNSKKLKKELEESKKEIEEHKTTNEDVLSRMRSLEEKCGWLERTLKETEETVNNVRKEKEEEVEKLQQENQKEIDELSAKHSEELRENEKRFQQVVTEKDEQAHLVSKLTQAAKDREVEYRIANKKTDNLVKDLKRQLNSERKKADQLQTKLQDFIQEIKVKQTYDEIFNPESLQLKTASAMSHKRTDSGSHISVVSSTGGFDAEDSASKIVRTSSPVESSSSLTGLSDETMDLISRIADLQQEKWMLEEKVKHLEENGAVMADDLMQKSLIIQTYVMENKADVSTHRHRSLTLKEKMIDKLKLGNTEELNREMNAKMQRMLEETLARNAQLQKDVDLLSKELDKATSSG